MNSIGAAVEPNERTKSKTQGTEQGRGGPFPKEREHD
jgi:hypothetical protein